MSAADTIPASLVLGVGNVLFGDEGLGVHLAALLRTNYHFTVSGHDQSENTGLRIIDGGTLGPHLIPLLAEHRRVLLLDTISADNAAPGEVFCFDYQQLPAPLKGRGSAHEVEMHQTLAMMRLAGDLPRITVLAVVPTIINQTTFQLSPEVVRAAGQMEEKALEIIAAWGFTATRTGADSISEIAGRCCQGVNHAP